MGIGRIRDILPNGQARFARSPAFFPVCSLACSRLREFSLKPHRMPSSPNHSPRSHARITQHRRLLQLDSPLGPDVLLPQRLIATERLNDGYEVTIDLLSTHTGIALEQLMRSQSRCGSGSMGRDPALAWLRAYRKTPGQ
jgi:hypothetical protein